MSPLAKAIYRLLRDRVARADPRITYAELVRELQDSSNEYEYLHHRNPQLYRALEEIGEECRRLNLPSLPALEVRSDTRRPGGGYYQGSSAATNGERIAEWRREMDAVRTAKYPRR